MIEKAIHSLLSGDPAITDLVASRIYPLVREQSAVLPAITYQIISNVPDYSFDGIGMKNCRVQINCFADDPLEAAGLAEVVEKSVEGFSGSPFDVRIEHVILEDVNDLPVITAGNEEMNVFAKTMDFLFMYKE